MLKLSNLFFVVLVIQIQMHFCAADEDVACPGKGWENATKTDSHCYVATDHIYTYFKAEEYCQGISGNLASIHFAEENTIVKNVCKDKLNDSNSDSKNCWIGMFKNSSGSWIWIDGESDNFLHWIDMETKNDVCSIINCDDEFWYHSDDPDTPLIGICKKELYTPNPHFTGGCTSFIREGCLEPSSSLIIHFPHSGILHCQGICLENENCNSFMVDLDSEICYLYTSYVEDVSKCQDVGGPQNPTMELCEKHECQGFFKSSCEQEDLEIVAAKKGISKLTDCENECILHSECKQWEIVDGKTCNMYSELKTCKKVRGPKLPNYGYCYTLKEKENEDMGCEGGAWEDSTKSNSHCYIRTAKRDTYYKARDYCRSIGGNLASIHTPEENTIVKNVCEHEMTGDSKSCWIGMFKDSSGSWVWIDGTPDNFEHWGDLETQRDAYSIINYEDEFWHYFDEPGTPLFGICKRQIDQTGSSTTTSSPQPVQPSDGCINFIREGCPKSDSTLIMQFASNETKQCQGVCKKNDECNSFLFDIDADKCYLYTSHVEDVSKCRDVGGPQKQTMEHCEKHGCEGFFKSSCEQEGQIVAAKKDISKLTDCEDECNLRTECKQWEIVNGKTCNMYSELKTCNTVIGPKQPSFKYCNSVPSKMYIH